ncbi:MAG: cytochrome c [Rhodospirillales bacterium]|nr:cytochrome c [Rhodospirillales bacterium]
MLALILTVISANANAEDVRQGIKLDPQIKEQFLAEMRGHMASLDDIVAAISTGDFAEAAQVADIRLDYGHRMWGAMEEEGATPEQIAAMKERMKSAGMGPGRGQGMGMGGGMGFGRYMPPEFRQMGFSMHDASQKLVAALKASAKPPVANDYANVLSALSELTGSCRGCHDAFRIEY